MKKFFWFLAVPTFSLFLSTAKANQNIDSPKVIFKCTSAVSDGSRSIFRIVLDNSIYIFNSYSPWQDPPLIEGEIVQPQLYEFDKEFIAFQMASEHGLRVHNSSDHLAFLGAGNTTVAWCSASEQIYRDEAMLGELYKTLSTP